MSKVKTIPGVRKSKLIASLRRKETALKKKDRFKKAANGEYAYARGYWVKDEKYVGHIAIDHIPEHVEEKKAYRYVNIRYINELGEVDEKIVAIPYIAERKVIPAHDRKRRYGGEWVEIPKRLRRANSTNIQKYCKKLTARKIRRKPLEEVYDNSSYKRLVDLQWELW